jgi:diguanylate cyclase (GGDEF)-like protein
VTADLTRDRACTIAASARCIAFPLSCRGRRVGALVALDRAAVGARAALAASMLRAVRMLLEPASVALDNALLLKRAEALSVTDDLTHCTTRATELGAAARNQARVAQRPAAVAAVHRSRRLQGVNDTHGHLFGSRALVEAAAVIRGSARETDVVARFGGDEFALVLPDTGGEGAFAVGERIRERIAAHRFLAGTASTFT